MTKAGYKQTEVGVIPEDWEVMPFSEVTNAITCGVAATPKYVSESYGKPFLSASHVQNGKVIADNFKFITIELYNQITKNNKPEKGDILYTRVGAGIGEAGVIEVDFDFAIYVSLTLIKPKKYLNSYFLKSLLNSNFYRFLANRDQFAGGGVQNLNVQVVREFPIPIPTLLEQTAIANALSDTDALISSLEKLITKKRNIKQGAMQTLLQPKEGWEVKKLGDIAEVIGGGTPSTFISSYWNGTINWFTPTEIGKSKYTFESVRKITKDGLLNCSGKILPIGTILLTSRAGIGDVSILMREGCTNQGFQSLISKDGYSNEYIYYLMLTLKNLLIQNASGSTFLEISPNKVKQIEVSIPDFAEQTQIATILSDMDTEITALETKLAKIKAIKLGMMQNLLTGKIRLI